MINALRVIWKSVKDIWEDMLILVLMNALSLVCIVPSLAILFGLPLLGIPLLFAILLSIPALIPFAGAWIALYTVCHRTANGFAIGWDHYWGAFKQYLIRSWLYMLFSIAVMAMIVINFFWYPSFFGAQDWVPWVQGVWIAVGFFWFVIQLYVYPFFVEQEVKSWRTALRNAALIAGANPLFTLILVIIAGLLTVLSAGLIPPLFVVIGLLIWVVVGTEAVANRIASYRKRLEADQAKKEPPPPARPSWDNTSAPRKSARNPSQDNEKE
jgi:hypothetical protein